MPNLIDFFAEKSNNDNQMEKLSGVKPCSKCELDVNEYFWDEKKLIMNKGLASLMYLIEKTNFNKNSNKYLQNQLKSP